MASPIFNFSGLASGLDTNSIVESLMQVERAPISRLQVRRAQYNQKLDAWTSITAKSSEFRTSIDALSSRADFDKFVSATTTDEDAVTVTLTGSPPPSSVTLSVIQLAATHQLAAGAGFTTGDDLVGAGTFSITTAAGTTDLATDATTTLNALALNINNADIGINAAIIQVTDSDFRLLLTAAESGEDAVFTTTSGLANLTTADEISTGADATLRIGDPVTGLDIVRSSNTFTNVIQGVSLDVKQAGTGPVTIGIDRDVEAATVAITSMVEAANGLLTEISTQTAYNAESDRASALTNDSTARNMALELQSILSGAITATGDIRHMGDLGIEFTRSNSYSIDETKLKEALTTDFDAVASIFTRTGTDTDPRVTYLGATGDTAPGSYEVIVTTAPEGPSIVGGAYVSSPSLENMDIRFGADTVTVGVTAGSSLADAIIQINDGLAALGLDEVFADDSGGAIRLTTPGRYGSDTDIEVSNDAAFGLNSIATGVDVAGTIGGLAASGSSRTLIGTTGDPVGLSVLVTATVADLAGGPLSLGDVGLTQGLIGGLDGWLDRVEGIDGEISRARGEWDTRIENVDSSIEAFEQRMTLREQQLRREFTAMETALAQLQSQSQFLSGFFAPQASS